MGSCTPTISNSIFVNGLLNINNRVPHIKMISSYKPKIRSLVKIKEGDKKDYIKIEMIILNLIIH